MEHGAVDVALEQEVLRSSLNGLQNELLVVHSGQDHHRAVGHFLEHPRQSIEVGCLRQHQFQQDRVVGALWQFPQSLVERGHPLQSHSPLRRTAEERLKQTGVRRAVFDQENVGLHRYLLFHCRPPDRGGRYMNPVDHDLPPLGTFPCVMADASCARACPAAGRTFFDPARSRRQTVERRRCGWDQASLRQSPARSVPALVSTRVRKLGKEGSGEEPLLCSFPRLRCTLPTESPEPSGAASKETIPADCPAPIFLRGSLSDTFRCYRRLSMSQRNHDFS